MDKIQEYYKNSLLNDLCADYRGRWQKTHGDKEELLKLSLSQQSIPHVVTYAYQGNGITKDYVLKEFGSYINGYTVENADGVSGYTYGLFCGLEGLVNAKNDINSFMWCNGADVEVEKTMCPRLYISNKSVVNLTLNGYNSIAIYLFDESILNIETCDETCDVIVYRYSKDASVVEGKFCYGNVKVFNKELRL